MIPPLPPAASLASRIFAQVFPDLLTSPTGDLPVRAFAPDEVLIEAGAVGDEAWLLLDGVVDVMGTGDAPALWARLSPGALFGEMALLGDGTTPRNASVIARSAGRALLVPRSLFLDAIARQPDVERLLLAERTRQETRATLAHSPLSALIASYGDDLEASTRTFAPGEALMHEGDAGEGMYIILSGTAAVRKQVDGRAIRLASLTRGACAGELSLLTGAPRAATISADTTVRALHVDKQRFLSVHAENEAFRAFLHTLRRFYQLPDKGLMFQQLTTFEGASCLQTTYTLGGARRVTCHSAPSRQLHVIEETGERAPTAAATWTYAAPGGPSVALAVDQRGAPVAARIEGDFADFQLLYRCFFESLPLPPTVGTDLARSGRLKLAARQLSRLDDDVVCTCMEVTRTQVHRVVRTYGSTAAQLEELLGCGSVCGGCRGDVEALASS